MQQNISSVCEFLTAIKESALEARMFRGQTQDWPLVPSIGRHSEAVNAYDNWQGFHSSLIRQYKRLGRPYIKSLALNETDTWVHGQHHGLPTRLLDWSTNPLKALFFSVNDPVDDEQDGVLWALIYSSWREVLDDQYRHLWDSELIPLMPDQSNARLIQQEGCFLSYPLPKNCEPLTSVNQLQCAEDDGLSFAKIIIPAKSKKFLRNELAALGIRYRLLFPDIEGVAKGIVMEDLASIAIRL